MTDILMGLEFLDAQQKYLTKYLKMLSYVHRLGIKCNTFKKKF